MRAACKARDVRASVSCALARAAAAAVLIACVLLVERAAGLPIGAPPLRMSPAEQTVGVPRQKSPNKVAPTKPRDNGEEVVLHFVAVVLDLLFQFDLGQPSEGFSCGNGTPETEVFVSGQDLLRGLVKFEVAALAIFDKTLQFQVGRLQLGSLALLLPGDLSDLDMGGLPLIEGCRKSCDLSLRCRQLLGSLFEFL